jgi:hypothetical protein
MIPHSLDYGHLVITQQHPSDTGYQRHTKIAASPPLGNVSFLSLASMLSPQYLCYNLGFSPSPKMFTPRPFPQQVTPADYETRKFNLLQEALALR